MRVLASGVVAATMLFASTSRGDGGPLKASVGPIFSYALGDGFIGEEEPADVFGPGGGFELNAAVGNGYFWFTTTYSRTYHVIGDQSPYARFSDVQAYHQRVSIGWQAQLCDARHARIGFIAANDLGYGSFHQAAADPVGNEANVRFDGIFFSNTLGACFRPARVFEIDMLARFDLGAIVDGSGEVTLGNTTIATEPASFGTKAIYELTPVLRLVFFYEPSDEDDEDREERARRRDRDEDDDEPSDRDEPAEPAFAEDE